MMGCAASGKVADFRRVSGAVLVGSGASTMGSAR
jgi:hypothetical protein